MQEENSTKKEMTSKPMHKGVQTLLGNPKKAIMKLAVPMMLAMSLQTIYNFVDALWVSGLGSDSLSAIGFVFPFFMMIMGISMGLGIGASSAISRKIGAKDKEGADNVAIHTIFLMLILAAALSIPLCLFANHIFSGLGAGDVADEAASYDAQS